MKYFSKQPTKSLRPPDLYEYFVDNFWFKEADLENQKINPPLKGSHNADVNIVRQDHVLMFQDRLHF